MTGPIFRPTLYLLQGCPFCFKVQLFLLEAGLIDRVDIHSFAPGTPELNAARAEIAPHLTKVSFPAAQLEPGRFVADSDDIIDFLAAGSGHEPESMPTLRLYVDGPLRLISRLWPENQALKASIAKAPA